MFNTSRIAASVLAAVGAALAAATPALAEPVEPFAPTANWDYSAPRTCFQELAVVPVGGATVMDAVNHCIEGNVLNHLKG